MKMRAIEEDPDAGEALLQELAVKGIIDDVSLTVATAESTEKFETIDLCAQPQKSIQIKHMAHVTKSVDRRLINEDFVSHIQVHTNHNLESIILTFH